MINNTEWCSGDVNHVDMSDTAFATIADPHCGVIRMIYKRVLCPFQTTIKIRQKEGADKYWWAVSFIDVACWGEIAHAELRDATPNTDWTPMARMEYGVWKYSSVFGLLPPISYRITSTSREVLTFNDMTTVIDYSNRTVDTHQQFKCGLPGEGPSPSYMPSPALTPISIVNQVPISAGPDMSQVPETQIPESQMPISEVSEIPQVPESDLIPEIIETPIESVPVEQNELETTSDSTILSLVHWVSIAMVLVCYVK
jgi:hypothetical protein